MIIRQAIAESSVTLSQIAQVMPSPEGEIQQGAFQGGFIRNDGFVFLLFVILPFHWNLKITSVADPPV